MKITVEVSSIEELREVSAALAGADTSKLALSPDGKPATKAELVEASTVEPEPKKPAAKRRVAKPAATAPEPSDADKLLEQATKLAQTEINEGRGQTLRGLIEELGEDTVKLTELSPEGLSALIAKLKD